MKRKLTAVLLTLCMVLGMLPMSAFAVWTVDGAEKADLVAANEIDVDGSHYYLKEGETLKETYAEGDTLTYYTADKTGTITLVWRADGAGDVTHDDTHTVTWTDNSDGTHTSACGTAGCDYEPVTENHTWGEGEVTTAATCGTAGVKTFTCTKCDATKTEEIPATGKHTENAVDNKDGTHTVTCSVCDTIIVENEKHTFENGKCTVCGAADPAAVKVEVPSENIDNTKTETINGEEVKVVEAKVTESVVNSAIEAAINGSEDITTAEDITAVTIEVPAAADTSKAVVSLPAAAVTKLVETKADVVVNTANVGGVKLAADVVKNLNPTTSVELTIAPKAVEKQADTDSEKIPESATAGVVDVTLTVDGEDKGSELGGNVTVSVAVNVTVPANDSLVLFHLDASGKMTHQTNATFVDGVLSWVTGHLSDWVYMLESEAKDAGLISGTGDNDNNGYYALTVTAPGVSIVVSGSDTDANGYYKAGSTVTGTVTLAADEEIKSATLSDGTEVTIDGANISFVMPAADVTLTVEVGKKASADELEVDIDTSDAKLDSYTVKGLTAGQTFAYYIQNADGKKVVSGSFVITGETFTQAVEKGFTYRVWTIDDTVTAVQIWNGDVDGTKYTGYYDSNPEEL